MDMAAGFFPLSPRTRRMHRGRGTVVLDNVTASTGMTNLTNIRNASFNSSTNSVDELSGPSPDEMVIAARGRRALPLTFSPDVHSTPPRGLVRSMSKLARPTSGVNRLLLPTRTSPRKRLTLTDSPPSSTTMSPSTPTTAAATPSPEKVKRSPVSKKCKLASPPLLIEADTPTRLKGLSNEQLMAIITNLVQKSPEIEKEVLEVLPDPDLSLMEDKLNYLKRNIFKALPNTRLESKRDSLAYSRSSLHLLGFKKELLDQGKRLAEACAWPSLVDHSIMAWGYVAATPIWDNPPHNNVRKQCFKSLATNILMALKKGVWSPEVCSDLKQK